MLLADKSRPRSRRKPVWVVVHHPAPESIPRPDRVVGVFASEESARSCVDEIEATRWGAYREAHRWEVAR